MNFFFLLLFHFFHSVALNNWRREDGVYYFLFLGCINEMESEEIVLSSELDHLGCMGGLLKVRF